MLSLVKSPKVFAVTILWNYMVVPMPVNWYWFWRIWVNWHKTHLGRVRHIYVIKLGHYWFRKWLVAWTAPGHYLNQCWNVNWTMSKKFQWNFNQNIKKFIEENNFEYRSGHKTVAVLLPGFAINWYQNQVTRELHLRDLTHMLSEKQRPFCLGLNVLTNYGSEQHKKSMPSQMTLPLSCGTLGVHACIAWCIPHEDLTP